MKPASFAIQTQRSGRKGFALILVLGILVVLTLLALTFSSIVQSDRRASVLQFEKTKATMLVDVAIDKVMSNLTSIAYNKNTDSLKMYPDYPGTQPPLPVPPVAPPAPRTVIPSRELPVNSSAKSLTPGELNQLLSIVDTGIPDIDNNYDGAVQLANYLRIVRNMNDVKSSPGWVTPEWVPLPDDKEFAYIAANFSGLYDASENSSARGNGVSGVEIESPFPPSAPNPHEWTASTTKYSHNKLGVLNQSQAWTTASPSLAGSSSPYIRVDDNNEFILYPISIGANALSAAVHRSGLLNDPNFDFVLDQLPAGTTPAFTNEQRARLKAGIIDFADPDDVPTLPITDPGHSTTESNPMFSEFVVTVDSSPAAGGAAGAQIKVTVQAEIAYPFTDASGSSYECTIQGTAQLEDASGAPAGGPQNINIANESVADDPATPFNMIPPSPTSQTITYSGSEASGTLVVTLSNPVIEIQGGAPVDGIIGDLVIEVPNVSLQGLGSVTVSREAIDPRFNSNPGLDWLPLPTNPPNPLTPNTPTPMAENNATIAWVANPLMDQGGEMYVSNEPFITTGELGYIAYDKWQTLSIYPRSDGGNMIYHRVYDFFTASNSASTRPQHVRRHLMNPNSIDYFDDGSASPPLLLTYVFQGAPIQKFPAPVTAATSTISHDDAKKIAKAIYDQGMSSTLPYASVSEVLLRIHNNNPAGLPHNIVGVTGELEAECVYRNTMDLLNVRQNYFAIILMVRKRNSLVAAEKVFLEVYRDAFHLPGTDRHPYVITRQIRPSMF